MVYNSSNFKEALEFIANCMQPNLLSQQIKLPQKQSKQLIEPKPKEKLNKLSITKTKPLENMALVDYMEKRAINTTIAKKYINETYYKI